VSGKTENKHEYIFQPQSTIMQ